MAWRDELIRAKQAIHGTFDWPAVLHHETEGDIPVNIKWHHSGSAVGRSGFSMMELEDHEFVFLLSELDGAVLTRDTSITFDAGGGHEFAGKIFKIIDPQEPVMIQQTCSVAVE